MWLTCGTLAARLGAREGRDHILQSFGHPADEHRSQRVWVGSIAELQGAQQGTRFTCGRVCAESLARWAAVHALCCRGPTTVCCPSTQLPRTSCTSSASLSRLLWGRLSMASPARPAAAAAAGHGCRSEWGRPRPSWSRSAEMHVGVQRGQPWHPPCSCFQMMPMSRTTAASTGVSNAPRCSQVPSTAGQRTTERMGQVSTKHRARPCMRMSRPCAGWQYPATSTCDGGLKLDAASDAKHAHKPCCVVLVQGRSRAHSCLQLLLAC